MATQYGTCTAIPSSNGQTEGNFRSRLLNGWDPQYTSDNNGLMISYQLLRIQMRSQSLMKHGGEKLKDD